MTTFLCKEIKQPRRLAAILLLSFCCGLSGVLRTSAAPGDSTEIQNQTDAPGKNTQPRFTVETYDVEGGPKLSMDAVFPILSKYTGTNVSLGEIAKAAAALQSECRKEGYPMPGVAIAQDQIINGVVTMNVFQAAVPQIIISGVRYFGPTNNGELSAWSPPHHPAIESVSTNAPPAPRPAPPPAPAPPVKPATPEQIAAARRHLIQEMARMETQENDNRIHVVSTNAGPRFEVEHYIINGNTILPPTTLAEVLTNIDGAYGTNVSFDGVKTVVEQLQQAYQERGYVTVAVAVPQQKLTNATVKLAVSEGQLVAINVEGNHYFSSNNVMRSLPSLHTNMVLNSYVFNSELHRANANQDRQIYPLIGPSPTPGANVLTLQVKDRLPLHAKVELNNQNSPGTPTLRVNSSAVYDNLWQHENSLGVQYGFSPERYKEGNQWNGVPWSFYDEPLVADMSAFYRMPLGNPEPIENVVANNPSFGYSEATRQFSLPPPSGQPELNVFASHASIDTGLLTPASGLIADIPNFLSIDHLDTEENLTVNNDVGARLTMPENSSSDFQSSFSGGPDFKTYKLTTFSTNTYVFTVITLNPSGGKETTKSSDISPNNTPPESLDYLPLDLTYNATWRNSGVILGFGIDMSVNAWYSGSRSNLQNIVGSKKATGHWVKLDPNFSADFPLPRGWAFSFHANGQWASEPLISTEQLGIGGVQSVRGYHEGEEFGDTGWRTSLELDTPPHIVGTVYDGQALTIQGLFYTDRADVYYLDPAAHGLDTVKLWGGGFGFNAAVGSHWSSQFLFTLPLISTAQVSRYEPYFNFSITAQF